VFKELGDMVYEGGKCGGDTVYNSRLESVASNGEEIYIEGLKSKSWLNGQGCVSMLGFVDLVIVVIKRY
jgi:hypothetical protein